MGGQVTSTFMLSTKKGKEAYVEPVIEDRGYRFTVKAGKPSDPDASKAGTKLSCGSFRCLLSDVPIRYEYIDDEANAGRMKEQLMAIVVAGDRMRLYLSPLSEAEAVARNAQPSWKPETPSRGTWASNAQGRRYGFRTFGDYFTPRPLVALTTFSDLVGEAMTRVRQDAAAAGLPDDGIPLRDGGTGATAYAEAVGVYLALAQSRLADWNNTLSRWESKAQVPQQLFGRQAIPMIWDFSEANPLGISTGSYLASIKNVERSFARLPGSVSESAFASQANVEEALVGGKVVSTDSPYYDNIGYADLSDFFYAWLRRSLRKILPDLFATMAVPKAEELVATHYRHGSKEEAEEFFLDGMTRAMERLAEHTHPAFPVTIYYAFKQSETKKSGTASTGWETFLAAVIQSGFGISGTWPMRTALSNRMIAAGTNALASSIVLVCRRRAQDAPLTSRREFLQALKAELPEALAYLQKSNIAPVDLAQAAIGPGMAIYTRYARVLESDGSPLSVRTALEMINQILDEVLAEQEGDFDADTRWALTWFEQSGFAAGDYGVAETLSKAKNTSVTGMVDAGILESGGGRVRLFRPQELPADYSPRTDTRRTVWEMVHHLIRTLEASGEGAAADLVVELDADADTARELAYCLYSICERTRRAPEALSYNSLVQNWPEIRRLAHEVGGSTQADLFEVS